MSFKRELLTSKNMALSTVRLQPGSFRKAGAYSSAKANVRERRVQATFLTANAPTPIYHGLGFPPSAFTPLVLGDARVYSDYPLRADSRVIVLKCDTANTVADILVR